jgi:DNA-binding beta-propeller fold protein YncE
MLAAGAALISACGESTVPITSTPIPPAAGKAGSIDVIDIDQDAHLLYAADRSDQGIDVFDVSAPRPKYLQTIPMPASPNGLAIAPDLGRLFAGTASGSVVIVDINTNSTGYGAVVREVKTGGNGVDLLDYGAARHRVYAADAAGGKIISIDSTSGSIMARFALGPIRLEQPRFDPADGMVYVTSPDADALFRIDPSSGVLVDKFTLGGCKPVGLAINPTTNKALMACHKYVLVFDLGSGESLGTFPLGNSDIVSYDSRIDRFFVASLPHAKTPGSVGIFGGNPIDYISSAVTNISGNSAAYDETNKVVYTPDIQANKAGLAVFAMPVPTSGWPALLDAWPYAALLVVFGLVFFFIMRSADPIRRPVPAPQPDPKTAAPRATDRPQQA